MDAGFAGTNLWAPRILLVATHADLASVTSLQRNGRGETKLANSTSLITSLQTSYGAELIIVPRVYVVDARQATGADMKALRAVISEMKQFVCQVKFRTSEIAMRAVHRCQKNTAVLIIFIHHKHGSSKNNKCNRNINKYTGDKFLQLIPTVKSQPVTSL